MAAQMAMQGTKAAAKMSRSGGSSHRSGRAATGITEPATINARPPSRFALGIIQAACVLVMRIMEHDGCG